MRVTRRAALKTVAGAGLAAAAGFGAYGSLYERRHAVVTRTTLTVHGLPRALSGLRIGLLSDIHYGEFMGADGVKAAVTLMTSERPDLVVLAGDFVTWSNRSAVAPCADALQGLSAPLGVYAVAGNHDPEPTLNSVFEERRIQVLRDEHARVIARGEPVAIGGLRYWSRKESDIDRVFRGAEGLPILVAHDPRRLTQASGLGVPLVLSGHTHGGQVVLPVLGAWAAARFPVAWGPARLRDTTLYVTRGLGTVFLPVRLNCPPEVAILTMA
jgi:uncharacterized protein